MCFIIEIVVLHALYELCTIDIDEALTEVHSWQQIMTTGRSGLCAYHVMNVKGPQPRAIFLHFKDLKGTKVRVPAAHHYVLQVATFFMALIAK